MLKLVGCELSDLDLEKLSRALGELQHLDLTRCYGYSDEGLEKLYRFKHLLALHLEALSEQEWEEKSQEEMQLSQGAGACVCVCVCAWLIRFVVARLTPLSSRSLSLSVFLSHRADSAASSSQHSGSQKSRRGARSHAVAFRTKIDTLKQLVEFCPRLQLLDLARRPIGNTAFLLVRFVRCRLISFFFPSCFPEGYLLAQLGKFPWLRLLDLSFSKITDSVLHKTESLFPRLELLRCVGCALFLLLSSSHLFFFFVSLPSSLCSLCHSPDITEDGVCKFVENTPSLLSLDVQHCSQFEGPSHFFPLSLSRCLSPPSFSQTHAVDRHCLQGSPCKRSWMNTWPRCPTCLRSTSARSASFNNGLS